MMKTKNYITLFAALVAVTLLAGATQASTADAVEKLVDTVLYPHDPSPTGVARWSEGTILSLDGKKHLMMLVTAFGQGAHDDTGASILRFDSLDGGLTWSPLDEAVVFQKSKGLAKQNVMSPALLRLDKGDILCFFMVKNSLSDCGVWMKRSTDNGNTWSKPERLPYEGYGGIASDRALLLSTGRILVPCWVSMDKLASDHAYCFYSDDHGQSWEKTALISAPKGTSGDRKTDPAAEEPMVVELKDGRLMMVMRVYLKSIYVSYSEDQGTTWSPPKSSGIPAPGSMTTLTRMPDGNILLIWNWTLEEKINGPWPRNVITAAVSSDEGKNFTYVRHLDGETDFPGKITMANVTFCDGNAVITYSKSMSMANHYNWRLQVLPIEWFYEGDTQQVYGEKYLPTLAEKIQKSP
jgi:sialidase-1